MSQVKTKTLMFVGLLLVVTSILFFAWDLGFIFPPQFAGTRQVIIPEHASVIEVGAILKQAGVINSANDFALYVWLSGNSHAVRSGKFNIPSGLSTPEVVLRVTSLQ